MIPKDQTELVVPLFLAFVLGILLMAVAYSPDIDLLKGRWGAAIAAATVISAVGLWFLISKRDVVDMEKAGDGCYYLGLTFTLFSLVVVLIGFEDNAGERTADVIPKFGVALISTLFGVIFRVALQSFASNDEVVEAPLTPEGTRALYGDALAQATRRTVHEMRTAEESFSRLARSARRQAESMEVRVARSGQQAGVAASEAFERIAESIQKVELSVERMQKQVAEQAQQIRDVKAETKSFTESTRGAIVETAKHVSASRKATTDLRDSMANVSKDAAKTARSVLDAQMKVEATVRESEHAAQVLKNVATTTKEVLNGLESDIQSAADNLKEAGESTAAATATAQAEAAKVIVDAASNAKKETIELRAEINSVTDDLKTVSREAVAAVHGTVHAAQLLGDTVSKTRSEAKLVEADVERTSNNLKEAGKEASSAIAAAKDAAKSIGDAVLHAKRVSSEVAAEIGRASGILDNASQDSVVIEPKIAETPGTIQIRSKGGNSNDSKRSP